MISLDNRLKTAAAMCRKGVTVCDVGTDHALLACHLALNGAREVIASDINDGPLDSARKTVEQTGVTNVRVLKSDGLQQIDYADDVIICGMGGELIADIISRCSFLSEYTRFILQPMTKHEVLRRELYRMGFEIISETAVSVRGKHYTVIHARHTGVSVQIGEAFAFVGKCTDKEYIGSVLKRLEKMARGNAAYAGVIREITGGGYDSP